MFAEGVPEWSQNEIIIGKCKELLKTTKFFLNSVFFLIIIIIIIIL